MKICVVLPACLEVNFQILIEVRTGGCIKTFFKRADGNKMDFIYKKNDSVTVTIEDMGTEGEGIGKVDGFPLFIKDAVPGDVVKAKVIKSKKNYAYARLEKVITPSPFRVEPKCVYHRQCGGCQLQTLSYERQLEFKQQKISNNLIRIGGFSPEYIEERMDPIIGMEEPFRYRNKAQYPVGKNRDGDIITGFYAGRTHTIIANTECYLGAAENKTILDIILKHMRRFHISSYDETTGKGMVRHILIRKGFTSGQIMVCLVLNKNMKKHPEQNAGQNMEKDADSGMRQTISETEYYCNKEFISGQDILLEELACVKGMTSVSVNINTERTNVIMGKEIYTLWGNPVISDTIHVRDMKRAGYPFTGKELTFHISPLSFYQINPVQTEKLYSVALEYAQLTGEETVWDLYCGIGTISLFLASNAKKVYGVEVIPQAIEDARENAKRNNIQNAEFILGKAEEVLPEFYERRGRFSEDYFHGHPDVIVVDPPRKGCDKACLDTMLKMKPQRIVYVSCDSATLARDLKVLCDGGYEIRKIRGVDQFGMTVHVETVVLIQRKDT
jgi:23S rRNA (uracil1939-C5)-methyltransferase